MLESDFITFDIDDESPFLGSEKDLLETNIRQRGDVGGSAKKVGLTNRRNTSDDLVMMKFDYAAGDKELEDKRLSTHKLRSDAYKDGVEITWRTYNKDGQPILGKDKKITYNMLYRSTGKAKEGQCVFVKKELLKKYREFMTMGLWDKMPDKGAKIVELSAYAPLITATAQGFVNLPIDNMFVVEDMKIQSDCPVCAVKVGKEECWEKDWAKLERLLNGHEYTAYKKKLEKYPNYTYITKKDFQSLEELNINEEIPMKQSKDPDGNVKERSYCYVDYKDKSIKAENTVWDGMGLVDSSLVPEGIGGFMYCRTSRYRMCLLGSCLPDRKIHVS